MPPAEPRPGLEAPRSDGACCFVSRLVEEGDLGQRLCLSLALAPPSLCFLVGKAMKLPPAPKAFSGGMKPRTGEDFVRCTELWVTMVIADAMRKTADGIKVDATATTLGRGLDHTPCAAPPHPTPVAGSCGSHVAPQETTQPTVPGTWQLQPWSSNCLDHASRETLAGGMVVPKKRVNR